MQTQLFSNMVGIKETESGVILNVHVVPRAPRSEFAGVQGGALKLRIAAPPVEGQANAECVRFLSAVLGVRKNQVKILSGHRSKKKTISVEGARRGDVEALIP